MLEALATKIKSDLKNELDYFVPSDTEEQKQN